MGLAVCVGMLADLETLDEEGKKMDEEGAVWIRGELEKVYQCLQSHQLPTFTEPEILNARPNAVPLDSFPYSFLHYLRRAYALQRQNIPLTPAGDDLTNAGLSLIDKVGAALDSHLLIHSDAEGFYVPIDFPEPILDDSVLTGMLGSSQGLLRELVAVASFLGIELTSENDLTPAAKEHLQAGIDEESPYEREYIVWYALYEAARFSIAHRTMIVFS